MIARRFLFLPLIASLMLWATGTAYGQSKLAVYRFEDGFCRYKGYYDASKFSDRQLDDTYALVESMLYFDGETLEDLTSNYNTLKGAIKAYDLVNHKKFVAARDSIIRYLEESYHIQKLQLQAMDDPAVLRSAFEDDSLSKVYTTALNEGGDSLLECYQQLVKEQMEHNANPEELWSLCQSNLQLDEKYDIAYDYVLTFGWWNRVNNLIYHYDNDGTLERGFHDLFERVVTEDCDEA